MNVPVIRYGVPSKHSFTLIENDKSIQINQTIWRMLRVGAPIFFLREQQLARKPDKDQIRLKGGRVASVGKNNR